MLLTGTKILPMDKLSRKITLDIDHSLISVRPIIKSKPCFHLIFTQYVCV